MKLHRWYTLNRPLVVHFKRPVTTIRKTKKTIEIQGQDQVTGLPRPVTLSTGEVVESLQETLQLMVVAIRNVLEQTPPELASDIIDRGMVICGGTSLLRGIDKWLTSETGVPAYMAEEPVACIAKGAAKSLGMIERLRRNLPEL